MADFVCGTTEKPRVLQLEDNLTTTADGKWVVWAFKLARVVGDLFAPLSGRGTYPSEATATCQAGSWRQHAAPDPLCSCGFHALSEPDVPGFSLYQGAALTVALFGRILAFEWHQGGVLFRAQRQTVVRVDPRPMCFEEILAELEVTRQRPDDPEGRLARIQGNNPAGTGPARLELPAEPVQVSISDDAGWCQVPAHGNLVWGPPELISVYARTASAQGRRGR